jgi:hypothetical protein
VAVDSPIVVTLVDYKGNPADMRIHLSATNGDEIALNETQRVPPSWNGCGAAELAFVRPEQKLEPGMTYAVAVTFAGETQLRQVSTFTVGTRTFAPEPAIAAHIDYLKAYAAPACAAEGCKNIAEVRVALDQAPDNLLWLVIQSSADKNAQNHWPFRPDGSRPDVIDGDEGIQTVQRSVMLPADDDCVDIRIYGREGRALLDERRCAPDRCATIDGSAASTCGDPPSAALDLSVVPEDSCQGPSLPHFSRGVLTNPGWNMATEAADDDGDAGVHPAEQDAKDPDASPIAKKRARPAQRAQFASCSTHPDTPSLALDGFALLVTCWILAARSRRSSKS